VPENKLIAIAAIVVTLIVAVIGWIIYYPSAEFTISIDNPSGRVDLGGSITNTVTIGESHGFNGIVNLRVKEKPDGVSVSFNKVELRPPETSIMTIVAEPDASPGDWDVIIEAIGGDGTEKSFRYLLTINQKTIIKPPTPPNDTLVAKITSPMDGTPVESPVEVTGTVSGGDLKNKALWLVVNPKELPGQFWPQGGGRIEPYNGEWSSLANIGGGDRDKGKEFDIYVILLDNEGDAQLNSWVKKTNAEHDWPSLSLPRNHEKLYRVTVTRS
jgi:hypothetical protein